VAVFIQKDAVVPSGASSPRGQFQACGGPFLPAMIGSALSLSARALTSSLRSAELLGFISKGIHYDRAMFSVLSSQLSLLSSLLTEGVQPSFISCCNRGLIGRVVTVNRANDLYPISLLSPLSKLEHQDQLMRPTNGGVMGLYVAIHSAVALQAHALLASGFKSIFRSKCSGKCSA
jgi:hypothetical protein